MTLSLAPISDKVVDVILAFGDVSESDGDVMAETECVRGVVISSLSASGPIWTCPLGSTSWRVWSSHSWFSLGRDWIVGGGREYGGLVGSPGGENGGEVLP